MVGREAARYRSESLSASGKGEYIFIYRECHDSAFALAVEHTDFGSKAQSRRAVIFRFAPVGETLYIFLYLRHHPGGGAVYLSHSVGGKENSVILEENQLRRTSLFSLIGIGFFLAECGENIAGLCGADPYGIGEKPSASRLTASRTGNAVDKRGMNMKHEFIGEQVMQERFHARALCFLACALCRHHVGEHLCFALRFVFGIFLFEHGRELFSVHFHKAALAYRGERCARALDIEHVFCFI